VHAGKLTPYGIAVNDSLVQKVIRRSNRNLLRVSLVGLALVAVLFFFNLRYF